MQTLINLSYTVSRVFGALMLCAFVAFSQANVQATADPPIELTRVDLFAAPLWTSKDVSVLGFRLGMTRKEASRNADALRMKLMGEDQRECSSTSRCYLADLRGFPTGIDLGFGNNGLLSNLSITRTAEDRQPSKHGGAPWVHWRFKGSTYELFSNYSDGLRHKLLGAEATETKEAITNTVTFRYPRRGVVLEVSPCPQQSLKEYCGDITLRFEPPAVQ